MKGVDDMLARLYEPIIWRSLKAANPCVRANATAVLADAFPLHTTDTTSATAAAAGGARGAMDALLFKQVTALQELLNDPVPDVRRVAASGVAHVLAIWWEVLPTSASHGLAGRLVQLGLDSVSGAVRAAVCNGLAEMLAMHLSHAVLKRTSFIPHIPFSTPSRIVFFSCPIFSGAYEL